MRPSLLSAPSAWLESSPTRWYLIFSSAERRHWWDKLFRTRSGFEHVYALRWDGWNWLIFNPHAAFTEVAIVAAVDEGQLWELVDPAATVLEVQAFRPLEGIRGRWWIGPMTCVEQVKALLGVPVGRIFTPWQLYRYFLEVSHGQALKALPASDGRQRTERPVGARHREQGQQEMAQGQPRRGGARGAFIVRRCQRPDPAR